MAKIAVIGAGLFGIECSLRLSKDHEVHLFEQNSNILSSASSINQFRIHRGFHYPRSPETVSELSKSIDLFLERYKECIIDSFDHYYCIAKENSLVNGEDYLKFCDENNLEYEKVDLDLVNKDKIDFSIKVKESIIDPKKLYDLCSRRLKESSVVVHILYPFSYGEHKQFDFVINCGYSGINSSLSSKYRKKYQYEVCEKIVVKLPEQFKNKSIVVLDGPFFCLDPYGDTENHLLGNVVYAVRNRNVGEYGYVPDEFKDKLNNGMLNVPKFSNFKKFQESMKDFIVGLEEMTYVGSLFTVRMVLPNVDKTDERPTIVEKINDKIIKVFSGKLDTCCRAAIEVEKLINV